jgi:TrmH family RNA methyltransferase
MDGPRPFLMTNKRITSRQNERVKRAVKLRERRGREKQGRIIVDGVRELGQALAAGVELEEVFLCPSRGQSLLCRDLVAQLEQRRAIVSDVTPEVFSKLAFGDRVEGILGVAKVPRRSLSDVVLPERPLVAVLEGVEKPGNLGAILRSADGAGVSAVVVANGGTDLYNPAAIRASLGTIFRLPVCAASVDQTLAWLSEQRLAIVAARPDGDRLYTEVDFSAGTAIVLGSEATGLSATWSGQACQRIRLPMLGAADSLNVAAAAAVIFYESLRQRKAKDR